MQSNSLRDDLRDAYIKIGTLEEKLKQKTKESESQAEELNVLRMKVHRQIDFYQSVLELMRNATE